VADPYSIQAAIGARLQAQLRTLAFMAGAPVESLPSQQSDVWQPQPPEAASVHAPLISREPERANVVAQSLGTPRLVREQRVRDDNPTSTQERPWPAAGTPIQRLRLAALLERRTHGREPVSSPVFACAPLLVRRSSLETLPAMASAPEPTMSTEHAKGATQRSETKAPLDRPRSQAATQRTDLPPASPRPVVHERGLGGATSTGSPSLANDLRGNVRSVEDRAAPLAWNDAPEPQGVSELSLAFAPTMSPQPWFDGAQAAPIPTLPGALELDDLEEHLGDILERLAAEAGVDLA